MGRRSWLDDVSEHDIQRYIEENFGRLGFEEIDGPFVRGPDFRGKVEGRDTAVEVEKECRNYLEHGHHLDPQYQPVDILVVLDPAIPRGAMRALLPPKIVAIDRDDFEEWLLEKQEAERRREETLRRRFDGMEIQIVRGGEVFFSSDLNSPKEDLGDTPEDEKYSSLVEYFSLVANERRAKVIRELIRRGSMRFSDILQIAGNPKLVKDCVEPLIEKGMLERDYQAGYRMTAKGDVISNYLLVAIPLVHKFVSELEDQALAEAEGDDDE
jgi:predicted transcriptional regulator